MSAYFHGPNAATGTSGTGIVETNFQVKLSAHLSKDTVRNGETIRIYGHKVTAGSAAKTVATCSTVTCIATVSSRVEAHWDFQAGLVSGNHYVLVSNVVSVIWYQKKPLSLELSVNGKSARASSAKPSNSDPVPLVVPYGTPLKITATADKPMPHGWKIEVHHNADVLSSNGNYYVVCRTTTTASCSATRPPPTAAITGDVDDIVYAQIASPDDGSYRYIQILVNYRKP